MTAFSIITLTVILLGVQHLLNWGWRKWKNNDYLAAFMLFLTLVSVALTIGIIETIVKWGQYLL